MVRRTNKIIANTDASDPGPMRMAPGKPRDKAENPILITQRTPTLLQIYKPRIEKLHILCVEMVKWLYMGFCLGIARAISQERQQTSDHRKLRSK